MVKSRHKWNINTVYYIVLAAIAIILLLWLFWPQAAVSQNSFGECLTTNGVTMYGSDQCSHCENQKKILGEDYKSINYVNCDFNEDECRQKGISFYPVWSRDNQVLAGVQSLQSLSEFSGCEL
jgi:hypothetical protein